jgi:uncharacterized protein (DUF934 family)
MLSSGLFELKQRSENLAVISVPFQAWQDGRDC